MVICKTGAYASCWSLVSSLIIQTGQSCVSEFRISHYCHGSKRYQQTVICWLQWEKIAFPHQSLCLRKGRQLDNCSVGQRQTLILSFTWEKTLGKSYGFLKQIDLSYLVEKSFIENMANCQQKHKYNIGNSFTQNMCLEGIMFKLY